MRTVRDLPALRHAVGEARSEGRRIGFVPTMGALHEGHLSLVRRAKAECGFAVVSIFVNPLQFAPDEDFERYPRRAEEDAALLRPAGTDLLYAPSHASFYPPDFSTSVEVARVTDGGEGAARPGHFRGVTTVVAKLFLQVGPDVAYFGRKDLQQTAVIRRMVRDLDFPLRVVVCDTIREADGLAMSSRNAFLSSEQRVRAAALSRALFHARDRAASGQTDAKRLEEETREELESAGLPVDYVELVETATMARAEVAGPGAALAAAVRVGKTRLLDNVLFEERKIT